MCVVQSQNLLDSNAFIVTATILSLLGACFFVAAGVLLFKKKNCELRIFFVKPYVLLLLGLLLILPSLIQSVRLYYLSTDAVKENFQVNIVKNDCL